MAVVLTQAGEEFIVDVYDLATPAGTDYVHWGTGAGTAAKGSVDLFTAATEARVTATRTQPAADKLQWVGTLTADAGKTITNAGVWDGAGTGSPPTGGTPLIIHADHASQALNSGDKIEYTFTLEVT